MPKKLIETIGGLVWLVALIALLAGIAVKAVMLLWSHSANGASLAFVLGCLLLAVITWKSER